MSPSYSSPFAVICLTLACAGVGPHALAGPTTAPAAVPADVLKRMASTTYQFRPSAAAVVGDPTLDFDPTADAATRLADAVTAGRWPDVAAVMALLPPEQATAVYHQIVASLNGTKPGTGVDVLRADDVLALADTLPVAVAMPPADLAMTGRLLSKTVTPAGLSAAALDRLSKGDGRLGNNSPRQRAETAAVLIAADDLDRARSYLPDAKVVLAADDADLDKLYLRYALPAAQRATASRDDSAAAALWETAFRLSLREMLRPGGATPEAVTRTFDLATQANRNDTLLDALRPVIKANAPALRTILVAAAVSPTPAPGTANAAARGVVLGMQADLAAMIVDGLPADVAVDDARAVALNQFAANWQIEAALLVTQWKAAPLPTRTTPRRSGPGDQTVRVLTAEELWGHAPQGKWRDHVSRPLRPSLDRHLIAVAMGVDDPDAAMAILADVAKAYPESDDLVAEALDWWAQQHKTLRIDPLTPTSTFQATGVPLTRTAQGRNVDQLVSLLDRVKAIYGRPYPARRLPELFDQIYSQAEVYDLADLQRVFGPLDQLDAPAAASLSDMMFGNLQSAWLFTSVQVANGTGRVDKEINDNVLNGYVTLDTLLGTAAEKTQDASLYRRLAEVKFANADVALALQRGYGVYNTLRAEAFEALHKSTGLRGSDRDPGAEARAYVNWFARALGVTRVKTISSHAVFVWSELDKLKAAIDALPADRATIARQALLNDVQTQLDSMKPDARHRAVQAVLRVAGEDPNARGLKTLVRFYDDLLAEVKFVAQIDGPPQVGTAPFGIVLSLRHTDRLERETRGFAKYVQNQFQNPSRTAGRPGTVANYRDDLEKHIRTTLSAAYDVQSVVWSPGDVVSHAAQQSGWRETPLCYVVAKAKDASTDRVPAVQIDLDFVDWVNEVVLPITSGTAVVDATRAEPRPVGPLAIEQTLNDHDAVSGGLELTVAVSGDGLMPSLDRVIDLGALRSLNVADVEDTGPQADEFETATGTPRVVSHRKWVVRLKIKPGEALPASFTFPTPAAPAVGAVVKYRRYSDADIVDAAERVTLNNVATPTRTTFWPWVVGLSLAATAAVLWSLRSRCGRAVLAAADTVTPVDRHPFNVLARLQRLNRSADTLPTERRERLAADIGQLERHYFMDSPEGATAPDVAGISDRWR